MSDGFLSRWARRKEAVKAAEQTAPSRVSAELTEPLRAPVLSPLQGGVRSGGGSELGDSEPPAPPASSPQGGGEAPDSASESAALGQQPAEGDAEPHLLELPSLDTLTSETDLTPFLRSGVPSALRNAALRRMWSVDPSIRDFVSEAREYAYDWNTPGGVPGLGPLLPSDDVKAMLGRLFRDPAEAKEPESEPPAEVPADAPAEPEAEVAQAIEEAPVTEPEPVQAPVAAAEPSQPRMAEALRPEPRLRRHGGAKPA